MEEKSGPNENKEKNIYEVIIIGGGPGGVSAAIYSFRYHLKTLLIAREIGGVAATAHKICNYPGIKEILGTELAQKYTEQVEFLKGENGTILYNEVKKIYKKEDNFVVETNNDSFIAKKVIFAPGAIHRKLNIPGEDSLVGKGVSYCATCDGPFFKNKTVAVIGGGNSALTAALILAEHASKVYIIYRKSEFFRTDPPWRESVNKNSKIEVIFNEEITAINGKNKVEGVTLKSTKKELALDGVFIEVGSIPNTEIIKELGVNQDDSYILVDENQETNVNGFYAAGDIIKNDYKQIVVAAAHGAIAATHIFKKLRNSNATTQY